MYITDLTREVTIGANSYYIEIGGFRIVLDAGLHPKYVGMECLPQLGLIGGEVDYIILTHCHLDHIGALPLVHQRYPGAPILLSMPSERLAGRIMRNSYTVMMKQREEGNIVEYPLYTPLLIESVEKQFQVMPVGVKRVLSKGGEELGVTFYCSGHVAGAVGCLLEYKHRRIFITSDVLFQDQYTVPRADFPEGPFDTLVMETTRGMTQRIEGRTRESEVKRLIKGINHTIERGGTCLIPAFAFGRVQEVLSILAEARGKGELVNAPVYCSGLGLDLINYYDGISKKTHLVDFHYRTIKNLKLKPPKEVFEPGKGVKQRGIYVLSSGMLVEKTPAYFLASAIVENHLNSVYFVGYCDPETPGGRLMGTKRGEGFNFEALKYVARVNADVEKYDLSSHADREQLLDFALKSGARSMVLVHGDSGAREWFKGEIEKADEKAKVLIPVPGERHLV